MNESKYSKVIFNEISESYPTDADIECRFYIGDSVKASEGDRIGLFKVGWVYAREGLVFKNVSKCETDNEFGEKKVRFDASQLPKSADEFFQFCYLTAGDDICGASTPFRFIRPHAEDLIQLTDNRNSDEEDFVVVRSQQALLQERLQQLVNENGVLEYSKRSLEQHMTSKSNEVSELRKMLVELEDRNKLSQLESTRIMAKLSSSEAQNCSHSERIEVLERELSEMRRSRDEYEARLAFTQSELNQLQDVVNGFEVKAFKCGEMLKTRDQEVFNLVKKTGEQQVLIDELSSTRAMVEAKLELSSTSIAKVMSERRDLESENRMLRSELEDTRAKCDSLQSKTDLMMAEILDFDKIKLKTKVQIQTANEEMVELKTRLDETEANKKATSGQWKQKEELFEKQIDELKSRLANAAEEYQKIYKYNTKLENRVDKIKAKVKKYFDTKSQTKAAVDVSLTERQELMAKAETEVKTVIVDMDTPLEERMSIRSLETPMESACALPLPTTTITRVKAIDGGCSGGGRESGQHYSVDTFAVHYM
ncbi:unnamed protein product [Medioppia subpectinata]|uniref:SKICH domain-containing protein n=1 Tax=Medioppia subpectinata TaxID=1979941 RepID=A0A7R9L026_9ACAR|nr:unnamed protein product [Medioppia subpectinata]CAG2112770.1 unnamed protein product [Medioppia subpectinata]